MTSNAPSNYTSDGKMNALSAMLWNVMSTVRDPSTEKNVKSIKITLKLITVK